MSSKYLGKVYDGLWEVINYEKRNGHIASYILKNIYNGNILKFSVNTIRKIDKGETTVSKIICEKIRASRNAAFFK